MSYIPNQGDIVLLDFDPSTGKEIMKRRPAYIISHQIFNEHTSFAIVAPVTNTIRGIKLEVLLPDNLAVKGSILVYQLKSLDYQERNAELIDKVTPEIIQQVSTVAQLLVR